MQIIMAHFKILSMTHTTKWIKSFFDMMNFNMTRSYIVLNQSMKYICACCCSHARKEFIVFIMIKVFLEFKV